MIWRYEEAEADLLSRSIDEGMCEFAVIWQNAVAVLQRLRVRRCDRYEVTEYVPAGGAAIQLEDVRVADETVN